MIVLNILLRKSINAVLFVTKNLLILNIFVTSFPKYKPVKTADRNKIEDIKFSREVDEICPLMGNYTASSGN
jgi:hypothetical protein